MLPTAVEDVVNFVASWPGVCLAPVQTQDSQVLWSRTVGTRCRNTLIICRQQSFGTKMSFAMNEATQMFIAVWTSCWFNYFVVPCLFPLWKLTWSKGTVITCCAVERWHPQAFCHKLSLAAQTKDRSEFRSWNPSWGMGGQRSGEERRVCTYLPVRGDGLTPVKMG